MSEGINMIYESIFLSGGFSARKIEIVSHDPSPVANPELVEQIAKATQGGPTGF